MKKLLCALIFAVSSLQAKQCCPTAQVITNPDPGCCRVQTTSHSFFSIRPEYQIDDPIYETFFHHDRLKAREYGHNGAFQATAFGGQSTNRHDVGAFFSPTGQTCLTVNGTPDADTDIAAFEFNIATVNGDFESIIKLAPRQTTFGVGLSYKQIFAVQECGREWWWGVSTPITYVKNNVGFSENVINDGGGVLATDATTGAATGAVANMTQAFSQSGWDYGRIDCKGRHKTGLADITVQLGYQYLNRENCQAETHIGVLIPTGNRVKGVNVFEPIIGHNKHVGAIIGSTINVQLFCCPEKDTTLWFDMHTHGLYLFRRNETRLLDVKGKPWSRYMQVYANQAQAELALTNDDPFLYTPGVNVFARDLSIKPGWQRSFNSAFVLTKSKFQGEAGFNYFSRQAECAKLACPWVEGPAFKSSEGLGFTNDQLNIHGGFVNENVAITALDKAVPSYSSNVIRAEDLDLLSASHPSVITYTAYAFLGYHCEMHEFPVFAGAGGSYEHATDNNGLTRWMLWAKSGFSF